MSISDSPANSRSPPPSVVEDEFLRDRLAEVTSIVFTHQLKKRLFDLQATQAPPRRRDSYQLYLDGYFEFAEKISERDALTPTPPSTNPTTPETFESPIRSKDEQLAQRGNGKAGQPRYPRGERWDRSSRSRRVKNEAHTPDAAKVYYLE